jgi:hypothetical protein
METVREQLDIIESSEETAIARSEDGCLFILEGEQALVCITPAGVVRPIATDEALEVRVALRQEPSN